MTVQSAAFCILTNCVALTRESKAKADSVRQGRILSQAGISVPQALPLRFVNVVGQQMTSDKAVPVDQVRGHLTGRENQVVLVRPPAPQKGQDTNQVVPGRRMAHGSLASNVVGHAL